MTLLLWLVLGGDVLFLGAVLAARLRRARRKLDQDWEAQSFEEER